MLDSQISFTPNLQMLLKRGRDSFKVFRGCDESLLLPLPVTASLVHNRIPSTALYGIEFLVCIAETESSFNRLQQSLAQSVLGIPGTRAASSV